MEKLTKKLSKLREDFNLYLYLKRNPEKSQGMTVKEVNNLLDSLGSETSLYDNSVSRKPMNVNYPRRSYQEALESVKSNIAAGRAVDDREM